MKRILSIGLLAAVLTGCTAQNAENSNTDNWLTAYQSLLQDFMQSENFIENDAAKSPYYNGSAFSLYDMTGDGIPELILSPDDSHGSACTIYSYQDTLTELGELGSFGKMRYEPETNVLVSSFTGQGTTTTVFYRAENGELQKLAELYDNSGAVSPAVYQINGEDASGEDYQAVWEQYTGENSVILGRDHMLTDSIIAAALTESADWMQTYRIVLNDYLDSGAAFSIRDVNGDGTPELFLSESDYHYSPCKIFSFDGHLIGLGELGFYGVLGFDAKRGLLVDSDLHQGYENSILRRLTEDFHIETVLTYSNNIGAAPEEEWRFTINGEVVSKEAYDAALAEYEAYTEYETAYATSIDSLGRKYSVSESNIEAAFQAFAEEENQ